MKMTPEELEARKDAEAEAAYDAALQAKKVAAVQRYGAALLKAEESRKQLAAACRAVLRTVLDREPTEVEVTILYMAA